MTTTRTLTLTFLLALVGLSGCMDLLGGDEDDGNDGAMDGNGDGMDGNDTDDGVNRTYHASLDADATSGEVPLNVTFTGEATYTETTGTGNDTFSDNFTYEGNLTYRLTFGDGTQEEGNHSAFPLETTHTYNVSGNFSAVLTIDFANGEQATATVNVTVEAGEPPREVPDQTEFSVGPSAGCVTETGSCVGITLAQESGEFVSGIDGHWIALDERYWGLSFTTTSDAAAEGDTDCLLFDADLAQTGEGNNGGGPCEGTVPGGTAWMYFFPWAAPMTEGTVTFQV